MTRLGAVGALFVSLGLAAGIVGCTSSAAHPSVGGALVRYRDQIFSDVTITKDLEYGSAPDLNNEPAALKLDLYEPSGDTAQQRPAIVWVHGGGYAGGDKAAGPASILAPLYAKLGYVFVSINYRLLAPQGCSAARGISATCYAAAVAAIHDAQAAVRWLRANASTYRIDADRIGIGGESAGAITATGVGVYSDQPGDSGNAGFPSTVRAWVSISGGLPGGILVDSSDAPGYLFSGTADRTVPYQWSVETANAMERSGVPVVLKTLQDAGHVPWTQYSDLFETESANFFFQYLDLAHASG